MKEFPLQLLGEMIAVAPDPKPPGQKILLPDWSRCLQGCVIAIGPDCHTVARGDTISFAATAGMESVFDGVAIRIMRESDVDFVVEP